MRRTGTVSSVWPSVFLPGLGHLWASPQHMAAERAGAMPVHPAVNAWLVELVLAWQQTKHVAALKVTQTNLRRGSRTSPQPSGAVCVRQTYKKKHAPVHTSPPTVHISSASLSSSVTCTPPSSGGAKYCCPPDDEEPEGTSSDRSAVSASSGERITPSVRFLFFDDDPRPQPALLNLLGSFTGAPPDAAQLACCAAARACSGSM